MFIIYPKNEAVLKWKRPLLTLLSQCLLTWAAARLKPKNPIPHQLPFPLSLTEDREHMKELTVLTTNWKGIALPALNPFSFPKAMRWYLLHYIAQIQCRCSLVCCLLPRGGLWVCRAFPQGVLKPSSRALSKHGITYKIRQNLKIICWAGFDVVSDHWHANAFL